MLRFDPAGSRISPEEFVARNSGRDQLHANDDSGGAKLSLRAQQAGDVALLQEIGSRLGFAVEIVAPGRYWRRGGFEHGRAPCGRRRTRRRAARLLGRPFALTGIDWARHGTRKHHRCSHAESRAGAGAVAKDRRLRHRDSRRVGSSTGGVTNVGFRPTFNGTHLSIESHLFDFSDTLTEGRLEVRFWERLRDEQKFSGAEELLSSDCRRSSNMPANFLRGSTRCQPPQRRREALAQANHSRNLQDQTGAPEQT